MTAKLIGNMLGISPGDVTKATGVLQKAGLIHYDAGEITVLDRAGVERHSCECYGVVKKETDRLPPLAAEKWATTRKSRLIGRKPRRADARQLESDFPACDSKLFGGRAHGVCRIGATRSKRLGLTGRRVPLRLSLHLRVDLRAEDNDVAAQVEP